MNNKTLLVTGGAGFIGANFVHYWLKHHPEDRVIVLDALTYAGNRENLACVNDNENFKFVHGNICDTALVINLLREEKINTLVHFAAESHVDRSITAPDAFIETNIIGTYSLLKAAKTVWLDEPKLIGNDVLPHRFHHVSTDEVYGTLAPDEPPFSETHPYQPNSPYSASKAASDHLVRAYHHTYGLEITTSNCSNNYGPFHFPEKLIPLVLTNILYNKPLPIYGDGQQIRDWLYVEDHARGIELILNNGVVGENYNIGGHNEWANIDIVKLICNKVNNAFSSYSELKNRFPMAIKASDSRAEELIEFINDRAGHDRRYAIDANKTKNALSYKPNESFDSGLNKTIDWYFNNESWWKGLIK